MGKFLNRGVTDFKSLNERFPGDKSSKGEKKSLKKLQLQVSFKN
jgi:hypothetical protein